jgi:transposase
MPRTHPPYAPEYRRRVVELARAGRPLKELAREFEPSVESIRQWVKQAEVDEGVRSDGLTTTEREELTRLRRENRILREEREILSKAAAWFAQETGATPILRRVWWMTLRHGVPPSFLPNTVYQTGSSPPLPPSGSPDCSGFWRPWRLPDSPRLRSPFRAALQRRGHRGLGRIPLITTAAADFSLRATARRPFRHEARSPQVRRRDLHRTTAGSTQ